LLAVLDLKPVAQDIQARLQNIVSESLRLGEEHH
jgi:hypothetical protein